MTVMSIIFLFPTSPTTTVGDMNYTVVVLGGVLFLSMVWYYIPVYGGIYWFTGPVKTVESSDPNLELHRFTNDRQQNSSSQLSASVSSNY